MNRASEVAWTFKADEEVAELAAKLAERVDAAEGETEALPSAALLEVLAERPMTVGELVQSIHVAHGDSAVSEALSFLEDAQFVTTDTSRETFAITPMGQFAVEHERGRGQL